MQDIRHITTSFTGPRIALAEFKTDVQVFDINTQQVIAEFETVLDFGGRRIVIDNDGRIVVCGAYEKHGICGYEAETGKLLWQRKDLKTVQQMQILRSDKNKLFTQFENGPSRLLHIRTGKDIDTLKGVELYVESKFEPVDVFDKAPKIEIVDRLTGIVKAKITPQSFAVLDISFAPGSILVSDSAGPLSCYDSAGGQLKWRNPINKDGHFLRLAYHEALGMFVGVSAPLTARGNKKLQYIHPGTGAIEKEIVIDNPTETEFALDGQILVTSDRELINVQTGEKKQWTEQ